MRKLFALTAAFVLTVSICGCESCSLFRGERAPQYPTCAGVRALRRAAADAPGLCAGGRLPNVRHTDGRHHFHDGACDNRPADFGWTVHLIAADVEYSTRSVRRS